MPKLLVFGNSGSGKSTMARRLADNQELAHLDLDNLAWLPTDPPERRPLTESGRQMAAFLQQHSSWVIEGCYADLLRLVDDPAATAIFLDLPVEDCIDNARNRPWEPHKYASKEVQDANLSMLINWIRDYPLRDDVLSRPAHRALYDGWGGKKHHIRTREDASSFAP